MCKPGVHSNGPSAVLSCILTPVVQSYECVDVRAIRIAEHIVDRMLAAAPADVVRRLVAGGAVVAVIARCQVTTDIPAHAFMRWAEGAVALLEWL